MEEGVLQSLKDPGDPLTNSLLPDLDTPISSIGWPFFPLARWINQKMGHRTATNSLLGTAIFAVLVLGAAWILSQGSAERARLMNYGWLLILGYGSHILVDTLNPTGVEVFWPCKVRCMCVLQRGLSHRVGRGRGLLVHDGLSDFESRNVSAGAGWIYFVFAPGIRVYLLRLDGL